MHAADSLHVQALQIVRLLFRVLLLGLFVCTPVSGHSPAGPPAAAGLVQITVQIFRCHGCE